MNTAISSLKREFPGIVAENVRLSEISRWRIGGVADCVVSPRSTEELAALRSWIHARGIPSVIFGETSNLLFSDEGLKALAIKVGRAFSNVTVEGNSIHALAGSWVPGLARTAMLAGLTGLEHTCGIPGTLGGLVCMNGGSQRKGIGTHVTKVQSIDARGMLVERGRQDCGFAYRTSVFQGNNEVIAKIELCLDFATDKRAVRREMLGIMRDRRSKFPQRLPNCGSVFVSNPAMYADYGPPGKVIESVGLKGHRIGNAVVSPMHANFIVNDIEGGGARAEEVLQLIALIKARVAQQTGYVMAVEVRHVLPNGEIVAL